MTQKVARKALVWCNTYSFLFGGWCVRFLLRPLLLTLENFSMKKTLIALAAVAVSSAAFAQATISGQIAGGFQNVDGKKTYGFQDTNLTFRASEDLGGGLTASGAFTIEGMTQRNATSDAKNPTNADTSMSLAGGFGTVTLASTRNSDLAVGANVAAISLSGNQYNTGNHGVFNTRGEFVVVGYTSPEVAPGLRVSVARAFAGYSDTTQKAAINSFGATYAQGPLTAAVVVKQRNAAAVSAGGKKNTTELNATYDLGVARVGAGWSSKRTNTDKAAMTFGVSAPLADAITVGFNYGKRDKAKYQDIGATYSLSKRTSVMVAYGTYTTGAAGTTTKNQSRIRVQHNF